MITSTRHQLIAAAAALLDRGGPAAVTLREVGRAAGVSHNAPYKHFTDKDDLLAAVAEAELAPLVPQGERGDPEALMLAYVRWALSAPERFKLTFGRWSREHAALTSTAQTARAALRNAVECAQSRGELPAGDSERLTALLLACAHGAADLALSGHLARDGKGRAAPEDLVGDLFAHLRRSAGA